MNNKLFLLLLIPFLSIAQKETRVQSKLEQVTIFEQGASFERQLAIELPAGEQQLIIERIPIQMDPGSIQIGTDANLEISSIRHDLSSAKYWRQDSEYQKLQKSLQNLEIDKAEKEALLEALRLESEFLSKNTSLGGTQGFSLAELQQISQYARSQKLKIRLQEQEINRELLALNAKLILYRKQMEDIKNRLSLLMAEIVVKLNNPRSQKINFVINYTIRSNASWSNNYDLRFNDLKEGLELNHKATINQNTGEDWNQVQLILVTGNPSQNTTMPLIRPAYVNFIYRQKSRGARASPQAMQELSVSYDAESNNNVSKFQQRDNFSINNQQNRIEFRAPKKYSIPHDSRENIPLRDLKLEASYEYQCTPSLDPSAYLMAIVKNWEQHQLLDGSVAIYNQGLFIGSAYMSFDATQDSLQISLGKDPSISVDYRRVFNKESKSFLGANRIQEYQYEIVLRNRKAKAIKLRVYDRVPISQNEDIKIEHEILNEGIMRDPKSGIIEWSLALPPNEEKKLGFEYQIRYPKDYQINW